MARSLPLFFPLLLMAAACSPTQTFGTVEGMRCSNFGDEVCSQEAGFPRARCDFDGTWHIQEHCGTSTCIVEGQVGGQTRTRCGNSPAVGGGRGLDSAGGSKDIVTSVDTAGSPDAKTEPKPDTAAATPVSCGGYSCDSKEMCTFVGTCESKACSMACKHGERCSFGVCLAHCSGTCASTEFCKFATDIKSADACTKLGCTQPMDLGTAVVAVGLQLATTPTVACGHLSGAKLALNQALTSVGIDGAGLSVGIVGGIETLAFADFAGKSSVALLAHADNAKPCPAGMPCGLLLSKAENLKPSTTATAGVCQLRWTANAQGRQDWLPLPLRLGTVRIPLHIRNADVQIGGDLQSAELCGFVTQAELNAALSGLSTTAGLGFQLKQATLAGAGKADLDSDGDGKLDAWSVAVTLKTQGAVLTKWGP